MQKDQKTNMERYISNKYQPLKSLNQVNFNTGKIRVIKEYFITER